MCECISGINMALKANNLEIAQSFIVGDGTMKMSPPQIRLWPIKGNPNQHTPVLYASHCPFCGEKYSTDDQEPPLKWVVEALNKR